MIFVIWEGLTSCAWYSSWWFPRIHHGWSLSFLCPPCLTLLPHNQIRYVYGVETVTLLAYSQSHDFYSLKIPLPMSDPSAPKSSVVWCEHWRNSYWWQAQVLSANALDSLAAPPLHASTQQHSEISLDFSKSPCLHLSMPAMFAAGEYLYSCVLTYKNKYPRSEKWHNRANLIKAIQRPGSGSIFQLGESQNRISLSYSSTTFHYLRSVKVTPEDFLYYSGHDFPSLSICRHTNAPDQLETRFEENIWKLPFTSKHAFCLSQSLHFVTLFWVNLLFCPL